MKKIFTVLGIVAAATLMNAQNLLTNPGFEDGLAPWAAGTTNTYTAPTLITTDSHEGSNSAGYVDPSATTGFYQNIPVAGGQTYTISFWYKTSAKTSSTSSNLARLWAIYKDASDKAVYTTADASTDTFRTNNKYLPTNNDTWVQYTATMPAGATATSLDVAVRVYGAASKAYFDDFVVVQGVLATGEVNASKHALIKNSVVSNELVFATKSSVQILDMTGRVVKTANVQDDTKLNVSELPKGTYIVKGLANGEMSAQKFIKK